MTAPLDRTRLAKLLGMLSSQHDGEVVTAARHADAVVRRAGLTWRDVLSEMRPPRVEDVAFGVAGEIAFCLRHRHHLTEWEAHFVASMRESAFFATTRQRNVLAGIVDKLRARAEAA